MRVYDLEQKKFITVDDTKITSKQEIGDMVLSIDFLIGKPGTSTIGKTFKASNFVNIIPKTGYGAGLSRIPNNYYTNDNKVESYFSDASLVAYNLETYKIDFNFDVNIIEEIEIPYFIEMIGDSCELIIYKI